MNFINPIDNVKEEAFRLVNIEKGTKGKSKKSIKLNAQCVLSSKLDSDGTPKDISGKKIKSTSFQSFKYYYNFRYI